MVNNWYAESREAIKRIYGDDWQLFAGLLACTSPNSALKSNLTLAKKAYNQIKTSGSISRNGYVNTHYQAINKFLSTGKVSGAKIEAFHRNLLGDESVVTVDVWMMRIHGKTGKAPNRIEREEIELRVAWQAKVDGVTPAQKQAELWAEVRGAGDSFASHLNQYRMF